MGSEISFMEIFLTNIRISTGYPGFDEGGFFVVLFRFARLLSVQSPVYFIPIVDVGKRGAY